MKTQFVRIFEKSKSVWPWALDVTLKKDGRTVTCDLVMFAEFLPYGEFRLAGIPVFQSVKVRDNGRHVLPVTGVSGYVQTLAYAYDGNFEMQDAELIQREIGKAYNRFNKLK